MSEQRKNLAKGIAGMAVVAALSGGTLWYTLTNLGKQEPVAIVQREEPVAIPYTNEDVTLEILANRNNPRLADGLSIRITGPTAQEASRNNPVYYEIPGIRHRPVGIQVSQDHYSLKDMFVTPQDIDGKVIRVYCTDSVTKQPKLLHTSTFRVRQ